MGGVWRRQCVTLEDPVRGVKIPDITAIPAGRYRISVTLSPAFTRALGRPTMLPLIHDVPDYEGIRMHRGRNPKHTRGCVLVGLTHDGANDLIDDHGIALAGMVSLLTAQPGWITITDDWRRAA